MLLQHKFIFGNKKPCKVSCLCRYSNISLSLEIKNLVKYRGLSFSENTSTTALYHCISAFDILIFYQIGVAGRTGAGKSSLIAAMFRMGELRGTIHIDGISMADVPLQNLPDKMSEWTLQNSSFIRLHHTVQPLAYNSFVVLYSYKSHLVSLPYVCLAFLFHQYLRCVTLNT